jgi:lipopolysaccharide/colanic/teichoic acid biosynthesis glycosyltransferase
MRAAPLAHEPLFYVEPISLSKLNLAGKRVMDIALAGIGLVAASPLIILAAIATKLEDGGPIFHRQQRVGHNGRLITIFKMRTMVVDAAARFGEVAALNERHDGPLFKLDSDPRVTRVGRALRATSIDELPQLVNVLSGAMSMVGPRPALPDEVAQFDEELLGRLAMRPGITGLWQLEARDNPSFHAYRRLDLVYVENWSILSDIAILLGTARAVLARSLAALRPGHDDENRAVLDLRRLESEPQQVQV